jgi:mannose-6-phosphate isomerase
MVIENVRMDALEKPWGRSNLGPWHKGNRKHSPIGELWFARPQSEISETRLLLKLLFTSQPLSIQVHPTDAFAHSLGLKQGKTEAWYVLSASEGAKIAVGLTRIITVKELRDAIGDGSIAGLVDWRPVATGDFIFVPAGTIHSLGAGLVVMEVQQRSDTTFRLFDFGRGRSLDVENAVGCADAGPADPALISSALTEMRTLLVASEYFVLELIDLPALSRWEFSATEEIWIFGLQGHASFGEIDLIAGEAIFAEQDSASLQVGVKGFKCLAAYSGGRPCFDLLRNASRKSGGLEFAEFSSRLALYAAANPRLAAGSTG